MIFLLTKNKQTNIMESENVAAGAAAGKEKAMNYVIKTLEEKFSISQIVNIHFFEFQKEFSTVAEKHPFSELIFVSKGNLYIRSDEYSGKLKKGEMIIHPANAVHSLSCDSHSNPTVIIIGFKGEIGALTYFSNHIVRLSPNNIRLLSNIIRESRNVFKPPYNKPTYDMKKKTQQLYGAEQLLKISIEQFLISIIREYTCREQNRNHSGIPFSTNELISYIDQNYLEKITIDELAFLFQSNRSDLCSGFKSATGKTIIQYALDKKADLAKNLIENTELPFSDISEQLRFVSQSYFSRFVISRFGKSPKRMREEAEGKKSDKAPKKTPEDRKGDRE